MALRPVLPAPALARGNEKKTAPALARGNEKKPGAVGAWTAEYHASSTKLLGNGTDGKLIQVCVRGSNEYHALKIPRLTHCTDLDIEREHTILKRVQGHPCMVEIVGVYTGDAPGLAHKQVALCMSMRLAGEDLSRFLKRQPGSRPPIKIVEIFLGQLLDGAAHMHGLQIIHRDIKPANILVPKSGDS
jgi:serine/threonine protein kinase